MPSPSGSLIGCVVPNGSPPRTLPPTGSGTPRRSAHSRQRPPYRYMLRSSIHPYAAMRWSNHWCMTISDETTHSQVECLVRSTVDDCPGLSHRIEVQTLHRAHSSRTHRSRARSERTGRRHPGSVARRSRPGTLPGPGPATRRRRPAVRAAAVGRPSTSCRTADRRRPRRRHQHDPICHRVVGRRLSADRCWWPSGRRRRPRRTGRSRSPVPQVDVASGCRAQLEPVRTPLAGR